MTAFDTIFDACAKIAGFGWTYVYSNSERKTTVEDKSIVYPAIFRAFAEEIKPTFDMFKRRERRLSLYIVELGFNTVTAEELQINIENIMDRFEIFYNEMINRGIEIEFAQTPFVNWNVTEMDEYGIAIELNIKYSNCG